MSAHTRGPWFVQPEYLTVYSMSHGESGMTCAVAKALCEQPGASAAKANAKLIAAAPDSHAANIAMLAAIDEAFDIKAIHDDEYVYDALPSSGVARAYFMARAAVAKAKRA